MPKVNTSSVRAEIAQVKQQFDALDGAGQLSAEARALFTTLLLIVELLVAVFLEKSTPKNSKNSSIPPSQSEQDKSAKPSGSNKKGPKQNDEQFDNGRTVEGTTISPVTQCGHCRRSLRRVPVFDHERRTRIDLVFEKRVEHVDAEVKQCPHCQATTKGEFPADMAGPEQCGMGVKAYVLNLITAQMVSLNRVQKLLKALIGARDLPKRPCSSMSFSSMRRWRPGKARPSSNCWLRQR